MSNILNTVLLALFAGLLFTACSETNQDVVTSEPDSSRAVTTAQPAAMPTAASEQTAKAAASYALPTPPVLKNQSGQTFDPQNYNEGLMLINVWATWCAPCRIEMPDLEELQGEFDPEQFQVIGVAADDADAVAEYLKTIEVTYPNYIGDPDQVFSWSEQLGNRVVGVPFSAIVDPSGAVRWTKMGGRILVEELEPVIHELINEIPKKEG